MSFRIVNSRIVWLVESKTPKTGAALAIPANTHLWMGSGPGLSIKKAQGKDFELDAVRQGPVEAGQVVVTDGSALGFDHLFHVVVMGQDLAWIEGAGRTAGESLLRECVRRKVREVVTHPFHRGVQGAGLEHAREMMEGLLATMEEGVAVDTVSVLVEDSDELKLFQDLFLQVLSGK